MSQLAGSPTAQAIVKANRVMDKRDFHPLSLKPLKLRIPVCNYVTDMTTHGKLDVAATTWVVSANTICNIFWFLKRPFTISFFFYIFLEIAPCLDCWTDFDDLYVI